MWLARTAFIGALMIAGAASAQYTTAVTPPFGDTTPNRVPTIAWVNNALTTPPALTSGLNLFGGVTTDGSSQLLLNGTVTSATSSDTISLHFHPTLSASSTSANADVISGVGILGSFAGNVSNFEWSQANLTIGSSYAGTAPNVTFYEANHLTVPGGYSSSTNVIGYQCDAGTFLGGNTSGHTFNICLNSLSTTASAGSGGTLTNESVFVGMPAGTGSGTTNNGLVISGNGGGAGATNFAINDTSTAQVLITGPATFNGGVSGVAVATNAALAAACTSSAGCASGPIYASGVWRNDYATGYGAPPLFFLPQTGTCAANSMANDGGSCVNSANGNSWKAQFTEIDPREFGAAGNGLVLDNSVPINTAVTFAATFGGNGVAGGTVRIHSPANWVICNPIVWKPGVSFLVDKDVELLTCAQSVAMGAQTAAYTANVVGTSVVTVTAVGSGAINIGDWVATGPNVPAGTFIQANASTPGTPCGGSACTGSGSTGTYNLSQAASGTTTGGSYTDNAPALAAMVQILAGAGNRVKEAEWSGGKLLGNLNATHIFDLQDFERIDIHRVFLADVNGAYVEVGNASQSATSFELNFFDNRIDRLSATHVPLGNYGIESLNSGANHEIHDNRFIGTNIGIYGQLADWYIEHNHMWTDPAGSRGDMLACVDLTNFGANIESNQCDIGTVGVDEGATLFAWIINPSSGGFSTNLAMNRANSQYGADKPAGSAMASLGASGSVYAYGNVAEFTSGHRWLNDFGGTVTALNNFGLGNVGGAVFTPTSQQLALRSGAVFVGGARSVMPSGLAGNNGAVLDFGGNAGSNTASLYAFDYNSAVGRALSLNKNGGVLRLENAAGGTAASFVCVDSANNIVIQVGACP